MKIDNALKNVQSPSQKGKVGKSKAQGTQEQTGVSDNVELTARSALMQSLESALAKLPDTDAGKIEEIRQAIAEGRFQVNEEVVAEKLIHEAMENLRRGGKI